MHQKKINNYFTKKPRLDDNNGNQIDQLSRNERCKTPEPSEVVRSDSSASSTRPAEIPANPNGVHGLDIGLYVNTTIDDDMKLKLLTECWTPELDYSFPKLTSRNLKFQRTWLTNYNWLSYSAHLNGSLCKYCTLFKNNGDERISFGKFVVKAHTKLNSAIEDFKKHQQQPYHQTCLDRAQNFKATQSGKIQRIDDSILSYKESKRREARNILMPIIECIRFCGGQGLALRGRDDSGRIEMAIPAQNDGNFRALLRLRANCGDQVLKNHLTTTRSDATYISPEIQNELITLVAKQIQTKIVHKINDAKCFSILGDETADVAGIKQLSICARYVETIEQNHVIREDFLTFTALTSMTGEFIGKTLKDEMQELHIDTRYLRGQGYDGASAMTSDEIGVQTVIRRDVRKEAIFVHCSSHALNLPLTDSCKVPEIRNTMDIIRSVSTFFRRSAKRLHKMKEQISSAELRSNATKLISYAETRFVQRHDAVMRFHELYDVILSTLTELQMDTDRDTRSSATQLHAAMLNSSFLTGLHICKEVMSITVTLSKQLQNVQLDLVAALDHVDEVVIFLRFLRSNAEMEFSKLFEIIENQAENYSIAIETPRLSSHQIHRQNLPSSTPEEYYRRSVYVPFLDHLISNLEERFLAHKATIQKLQQLIPMYITESQELDSGIFDFYSSDFNKPIDSVVKWSTVAKDKRPQNALEALDHCDRTFFPNVYALLKILATLPVSTCAPERSFSALRRLKNYLRNTMGEHRLIGLALMNIYRDIEVDVQAVIESFMNSKARKLLRGI